MSSFITNNTSNSSINTLAKDVKVQGISNLSQNGVVKPNSKPKLLILTQVLPFPPDAGPKIKTFNLIRFLSSKFSITLVSFVRAENTPDHIKALLQYCAEVHTVVMPRSRRRDIVALFQSLLTAEPFLMKRDQLNEMQELLKQLVNKNPNFAAVHADQLNMAQYALSLPIKVKVLDQHNAVWTIADRLRKGQSNPVKKAILWLETLKLRRYEKEICQRFEAVLAVSKQDEAALGLPCTVVPIGIDAEGIEPIQLRKGSLNLVSLGTMFYPPNIEAVLWFGREVFPLILQKHPKATFTIIGAKPPASVLEMATQNPSILVTGYVNDLRPVLEESAGMVVPILAGGGIRVKILEALALGIPIVSTTQGAEGINFLEHEKNILIADRPNDFAQACLNLLDPNGPANKLTESGRCLALSTYDFRRAYLPVNELYSRLIPANSEQIKNL